jgi:hypothetical protein
MMIKTIFQVTIIVLSKTVGKTDFMTHIICYFLVFLSFFLVNLRVRAFNYPVLWGWYIASLSCILWLEILNLCDRTSSNHLAYVIMLFVGWLIILIVASIVISKKFTKLVYFQDNS